MKFQVTFKTPDVIDTTAYETITDLSDSLTDEQKDELSDTIKSTMLK